MQKRILVISDISCVGKCSLTVALPVLSACGHECVVLPTAVLSTHTAADFGAYTCLDMTAQLAPIVQHWRALALHFDAIYVGYLTSAAQAQLVAQLVNELRAPDTVVVVDPILGDNGQMYRGLSAQNVEAVRALCASADVITPNLTEAALLTGLAYTQADAVAARRLCDALASIGAARAILTGVSFPADRVGIFSRDFTADTESTHEDAHVGGMLHGTGDLFASAFVGLYLHGLPFHKAAEKAAYFTAACIRENAASPDDRWYGIRFETELYRLKDLCN